MSTQNPAGENSGQGLGWFTQAHTALLAADAEYHRGESSENAARQDGDNDENEDDGAHQNRAISLPAMTAAGNTNLGGMVCMKRIMRQSART